jgi:[acyl-carrier-protein] S-malonyltransferase
MATPWVEAFPKTCKPFLEEMDHVLQTPLSQIIADGPNSKLNATNNSQPAIMATSIMILRVLENDFGFDITEKVDVTLGHSLGEFAAVVAGGYLEYKDSLRIIQRRAEAMHRCTQEAIAAGNGAEYGMVALVCEPDRLNSLIETIEEFLGHTPFPAAGSDLDVELHIPAIQQVLIANINSKNQIVLSGDIARINELLVQLRQFGGHDPRAVRLNSDSPFHSPIMMPAKTAMKNLLAKTEVTFPGKFPCISNVNGRPFESADHLRDLLARQCVETVRWWDSNKYVDQEMGVRRWVGLGPGKVGRNLVGKEVGMRGRDTVRGGGVWGISRPEEMEEFLKGMEASEGADADGD